MADLARRERIAVAVLTALGTVTGLLHPPERNRRASVDVAEAPALVMFDLGHTADQNDYGLTTYTMQFEIEGTVGGAETDLGPGVNALYAGAVLAVMADPTLGGLCSTLRETGLDVRVAPEAESGKPLATFSLQIEAEFETPDNDPTG